jgi:hypothetical protein
MLLITTVAEWLRCSELHRAPVQRVDQSPRRVLRIFNCRGLWPRGLPFLFESDRRPTAFAQHAVNFQQVRAGSTAAVRGVQRGNA